MHLLCKQARTCDLLASKACPGPCIFVARHGTGARQGGMYLCHVLLQRWRRLSTCLSVWLRAISCAPAKYCCLTGLVCASRQQEGKALMLAGL